MTSNPTNEPTDPARLLQLMQLADSALPIGGAAHSFVAVENSRHIGKRDTIHNSAMPGLEVDPENYEVRADGELLTCEPASVLPLAQRYFLF